MEVFEVDNIEEAVDLAYKLKDEGRYDWFRGQIKDWPPFSSLWRIEINHPEEVEKHNQRIIIFEKWVKLIPDLKYLTKNKYKHDLIAILQHYSIPTHYIDFTTDPGVAGFFAADTVNIPTEGKSCIYCLNTKELIEFWNMVKGFDSRKGASIELIEIDVKNLWRLQAQKGVFLFADWNWDVDYPMDRILFPYSGYPSYPTRERIYPEKSSLEILLDRYFSIEKSNSGFDFIIDIIKKNPGFKENIIIFDPLPNGYNTEVFPDSSKMVPLESWSKEATAPWLVYRKEDFEQARGLVIKLDLTSSSENDLMKKVSYGVKQFLRTEANIRKKMVSWEFISLPKLLSGVDLKEAFTVLWNGMRYLPYSKEEIGDAFGAVAILIMAGFKGMNIGQREEEIFSRLFGKCMRVQLSYDDGSNANALVCRESMQKALRTDIHEIISNRHKKFSHDLYKLFSTVNKPQLIFEFEEMHKIFAREIIPSQVASGSDLILFNPALISVIGNQ